MTHLCPLCHKAEPIAKVEYSAVSPTYDMSAAVTLRENVCGRCGHSVAQAALNAATLHYSALRKKAGK